MKTRMILSVGLSATVLGGLLVGCTANDAHVAAAGAHSAKADAKAAAAAANDATRAIGRRDGMAAVRFAESAVRLAPRDASYRITLGRSYLQAGRFVSAKTAFADALELAPQDGRAALNLALAAIALGDVGDARSVLARHATDIAPVDLGLALALAGVPAEGVQVLTQAARLPGATAKVRQNLALSLALAGQWPAARLVASADMAPADVDQRLQQWAVFAQPDAPADQVASLLGVRPAIDPGQPAMLALAAPVGPQSASALVAAAPVGQTVPPTPVVAAMAPVPVSPAIRFTAPREVVQPLSAPLLRSLSTPMKVAASVAPVAPASGDWYVQLGAYENAEVARDGWSRFRRRSALLAGHTPNGTTIQTAQGRFYRLSIGGFAKDDADQVCRAYRRQGGQCFVRRQAGDAVAQWVRAAGTVQMAAR